MSHEGARFPNGSLQVISPNRLPINHPKVLPGMLRLPNTTGKNRTGKNRSRQILQMQCTAQIHPSGRHTFRSSNLEIAIVYPTSLRACAGQQMLLISRRPNGRKYLCLGKVPIKQSMRILETGVKVAGAPDTDQARPHQTNPIPSLWEKGQGQEGTQTEGR